MAGHLLHTKDGTMPFLVGMNELGEAGYRGVNDFVAENYRKWFVTDQPLSAEDRMAKSEGFRLTDVAEVCECRNVPHLAQELRLAVALEVFFQFDGPVEVVLDRTFPPPGDNDNVFDSGGDRFFHGILNEWFVDERQHFFGRRFRRGKEARAEASGGNHSFTDIIA
jgi:hypothetical protein